MKTKTFLILETEYSIMLEFISYLVLYLIPFTFNGKELEFTASANFIADVMSMDPKLECLKFQTK